MKKILIVEDTPLNMDLMVQLLEDNFELLKAIDGAQGLKLASEERPDLILMDLSLPVLDGWEVTRRLKNDLALAAIPVVALTAHAMEGDEESARAAGCDAYLTKPVDEDLLFQTIEQFLPGESS
jgi:two-component system cell cycle response regulator DivK